MKKKSTHKVCLCVSCVLCSNEVRVWQRCRWRWWWWDSTQHERTTSSILFNASYTFIQWKHSNPNSKKNMLWWEMGTAQQKHTANKKNRLKENEVNNTKKKLVRLVNGVPLYCDYNGLNCIWCIMPTNAVRHILSHTRSSHTRARTHAQHAARICLRAYKFMCSRAVRNELQCGIVWDS